MTIRCLFYTPGETHTCEVLRAAGLQEMQPHTRKQLQARYCACGAFIACPIFSRVEQGLDEANRLRIQRRHDQQHRLCPSELFNY